jgi:SAM-dependent methyltransferase
MHGVGPRRRLRLTPAELTGVEPSEGLIRYARAQITDPRTRFEIGDAMALPFPDGRFDAMASGLVLNFVPEPARAMAEFTRVATSGRTVAAYVWDYAEGMAMLGDFWDAATVLDPAAAALDGGAAVPAVPGGAAARVVGRRGLADVVVEAIEVPTALRDFDDYWAPFLGGQAPAPGYVGSLAEDRKAALRDMLRRWLPGRTDRSPLRLSPGQYADTARRSSGPSAGTPTTFDSSFDQPATSPGPDPNAGSVQRNVRTKLAADSVR